MKKLIALLLALVMVLSMVACAKTDAPAADAPAADAPAADAPAADAPAADAPAADSDKEWDELYEIDMLVDDKLVDCSLETQIGQYIADRFGIVFNYYVAAGDSKEQQALMLASGDYNEIAYMQGTDMYQKYVEAGALICLDDYKDLLPDFYARYGECIEYWRTATADGKLYKWETSPIREAPISKKTFDIAVRSDVLEYYGYPELVSASDWTAFLEKAIVDFPTTYDGTATIGMTLPLAESYGAAGLLPVGYEKGSTIPLGSNGYFLFDYEQDQFVDYLSDEVKESYQFFNTLYNKGILDEECFTDTADITFQKMSNGSAIAVFYVNWYNDSANAALTEAGHPEMSYLQMPFQLDSQIGGPRFYGDAIVADYGTYGISKNCKDPERIIKFINWCCTEEGAIMLMSGLEGVHYEVQDGVRVPIADQATASADGLLFSNLVGMRGLPYTYEMADDGKPYPLFYDQAYVDGAALTDRLKEVYAGLGWNSSRQWWEENMEIIDVTIPKTIVLDATSDLGKTGEKLTETRVKYSANIVMAEDFEAAWTDFTEEYYKLDAAAVIAEMNRLYAEAKAKLG